MIANCDCVLFDLDGTLVPNLDLPELRRQVTELTLPYGVAREELDKRFIVEGIDYAALQIEARSADLARAYRERAHTHVRDFELEAARRTRPFPGVRELLEQMRRSGIASGIVTRNCDEALGHMFADADEVFDVVLTRDRVEHLKPDPRHLSQALETLDRSPATSVMVGDGRSDMEVGRKVGLYCVGVLSGGATRSQLEAAGADLVMERVTDLRVQAGG